MKGVIWINSWGGDYEFKTTPLSYTFELVNYFWRNENRPLEVSFKKRIRWKVDLSSENESIEVGGQRFHCLISADLQWGISAKIVQNTMVFYFESFVLRAQMDFWPNSFFKWKFILSILALSIFKAQFQCIW